MKTQLLNKGEIKIALNLLQKIEHNLQLNNIKDYELYCAVETLISYLSIMEPIK